MYTAYETTQWVLADNFTITSGSNITGAGIYLTGYQGIANWDGTMTYYFFADDAGKPGTLLDSNIAQNIVTTGPIGTATINHNYYVYSVKFDLASAFAAAAGTSYWFGIHASTDFDQDKIYFVLYSPG